MSKYYNSQRVSGLYQSDRQEPFKLSRSKIDLFLDCPRCFYLDRKLGVGRPPGFPFTLNSAVDTLLKKEFDIHRANNRAHPMMEEYGLKAVPYQHQEIDNWRNVFHGIQYLHQPTNLLIFGAIDDIWINSDQELIIVDYKATAKNSEINIDADWQIAFKRQMEIYQWLFRQNGFKVCDTGYFVYVNGKSDKKAFDGKLEFDIHLIPYQGKTDWIEQTINQIHQCLNSQNIPKSNPDCDYCSYWQSRDQAEKK